MLSNSTTDYNFSFNAQLSGGDLVFLTCIVKNDLFGVELFEADLYYQGFSVFLLPVAPIKALCSQCFESWNKKFSPLGLTCKELTGDTEIDDLLEIQDSHIILTTPVGCSSLGN